MGHECTNITINNCSSNQQLIKTDSAFICTGNVCVCVCAGGRVVCIVDGCRVGGKLELCIFLVNGGFGVPPQKILEIAGLLGSF